MIELKKKNVYLMQIQNMISGKYFLPLSLGYLWSYCQTNPVIQRSYNLKGLFVFREKLEQYLSSMEVPFVVGISVYVWNWRVSKKFALKVKERWPDAKIVMGGPQVPYDPGFFTKFNAVDFIVTYEGEEQFAGLLLELIKSEPNFNSIDGLLHKKSFHLKKRASQKTIDHIPSPYLSGIYDQLLAENEKGLFNMVMETNRGCPYTCTFCDMHDNYYTKIRCFDFERVKAELKWATENKIEYIECADSNFGILKRDVEIVEYICELRKKTGNPKGFNFTSAKNQPKNVEKIQELLMENNLKRGISVSLQSFSLEVQKAIMRWNADFEGIKKRLRYYSGKKYESYVELIIGLPLETKESWIQGINGLLDMDYNGTILIHPLSVVPNTPFSNPQYISRYGLKYTLTRSPAQGFCFGTESPEERELICYASNSMSLEDWLDSYYYGKSLVGAYYYHRLCYFLVEYLKKEGFCSRGDFFSLLLDYVKTTDHFLGKEYNNSIDFLKKTLFDLRPWGRKIFSEKDMYWSDQAASAMSALKEYKLFKEDILRFCEKNGWLQNRILIEEIMDFNFSMLERPETGNRTLEVFACDWWSYFNSQNSLLSHHTYAHEHTSQHRVRYSVVRKNYKDYRDHALNVYWFGRKSQRALVQGVSYEV